MVSGSYLARFDEKPWDTTVRPPDQSGAVVVAAEIFASGFVRTKPVTDQTAHTNPAPTG
jgi:hypothetical protein